MYMNTITEVSQTELAWAAGFFDGEGCTSLKKETAILYISITQNHPAVLERFQAAVQCGKIYGPYVMKATGNNRWAFHVSSKVAMVILGKLWPYLDSEKKQQAVRCLDTITERLNGAEFGQSGQRRILPYGHGTTTRYRKGCRCDDCKRAKKEAAKKAYRKKPNVL